MAALDECPCYMVACTPCHCKSVTQHSCSQDDDSEPSVSARAAAKASQPRQHSGDWVNDAVARCKSSVWTWLYGDPDYPRSTSAQQQPYSREYSAGQIPCNTEVGLPMQACRYMLLHSAFQVIQPVAHCR